MTSSAAPTLVMAIYVAIGAGLLAYTLSDDYCRADLAEFPVWDQLAYMGLFIFGWPLIVFGGEE